MPYQKKLQNKNLPSDYDYFYSDRDHRPSDCDHPSTDCDHHSSSCDHLSRDCDYHSSGSVIIIWWRVQPGADKVGKAGASFVREGADLLIFLHD